MLITVVLFDKRHSGLAELGEALGELILEEALFESVVEEVVAAAERVELVLNEAHFETLVEGGPPVQRVGLHCDIQIYYIIPALSGPHSPQQ